MSRLLVFLHLLMKQRALQAELSEALSALTITAVGRVADFDRALQQGQDAVLTLTPVLESHGFTPRLRGYRHGRSDEPYALVSVDRMPARESIRGVGALDLLGREGTVEFVHELVDAEPNVERVSKLEDLLPLLQLKRVEAILLPARLVPELQRTSEMRLVARELEHRVGLVALAVLTPAGNQPLSAVTKLKPDILQQLGIDAWR
ncbi:MAG: hypothetical protein QM778_15385 [Myxococcales bacterium]